MEHGRSAQRRTTASLIRRSVSRESESSSPAGSPGEYGGDVYRRAMKCAPFLGGAASAMLLCAGVALVARAFAKDPQRAPSGLSRVEFDAIRRRSPAIPDDLADACRKVWKADTGGLSCGERIAWILANKHVTTEEAASAVADEFKDQCGVCKTVPTPAPTSIPTRYAGLQGVYQALVGVAQHDGQILGEFKGSVAQCSRRCDGMGHCLSFRYCAGTCHMSSAQLSADSPVTSDDICSTFYRIDNAAISSSPCGLQAQPPAAPKLATDLNSVVWPEMCFVGKAEEHMFLIGDWGGIEPHSFFNRGDTPKTADNTKSTLHPRGFWPAEDRHSQQLVAKHFNERAKTSNPRFVLNVGDNFYWGGINRKCGNPADKVFPDVRRQFLTVFEEIYKGPGVDGKPWLSVLGNHDYGGFCFSNGWDQQVAYTWEESSGRWVMPAQYWSTFVRYPEQDFTIDFVFLDNNYLDAKHPHEDPEHNICGAKWNGRQSVQDCKETGPHSIWDCVAWFRELWEKQLPWLEAKLNASTADWQIVVSHFPPEDWYHGKRWRSLAAQYGIDLWVAGHRHTQEVHYPSQMGPTAYVVTGGGGGVTSEGVPTRDGPDYGYMDVTISKTELKIEAFAFRRANEWKKTTTVVSPRPRAVSVPLSSCDIVVNKRTSGGGTCGSHIKDLMEHGHMNSSQARREVAARFPDPCSACAADPAVGLPPTLEYTPPHELDYYNTSNAHEVAMYTDPGSGDGMGVDHEL